MKYWIMACTEESLNNLPQNHGFRLRGTEMTRLETFTDAAFAFAITMLVISVGKIPGNYDELVFALKGVPAFAASFAGIMFFWAGHRKWSRRFGLEDGATTIVSLCLVFVMLVYVYPLRLMFSALFAWISDGALPSEFAIDEQGELVSLFIVYGLGLTALSTMLTLLNLRARFAAQLLQLNDLELILTNEEIVIWSVQAITGLVSACFAWLMPIRIGVFAGFVYVTFPITMPIVAIHFSKKVITLQSKNANSTDDN